MLSFLFRPAMALMERLPAKRKMALIGLVFVLPIVYLSWQMFSDDTANLEFARREMIGTKHLQPVMSLVQHIQQHRGAVTALKKGDATFAQVVSQKQGDIAEDIRRIEEQEKQYGGLLKTSEEWQSIKSDWQNLQQRVQSLSPTESFEGHTALVERLLRFAVKVADSSNLSLDPEYESYYLMSVSVHTYPWLTEYMGRARAMGIAVLASKGTSSQREALSLSQCVGLAKQQLESASESMEKIFSADATVRSKLQATYDQARREAEEYLAVANRVAQGSAAGITPKEYFDTATRAIDAQYQMQSAVHEALSDVLSSRVVHQYWHRSLDAFIAIVPVVLAFWLFAGFYFSTVNSMRVLLQGSERMAQGDAHVDLSSIRSRDEMGQIASAFGEVAQYMKDLAARASQIAQGDLTVKIVPRSDRDILGHAFASMTDNLRQLVSQVIQSASQVAATSQQLSASTEQSGHASNEIARGGEQLAQQATEAARAMDNMDRAIRNVQQSSRSQREAAQQAEEGMRQAAQAVEEVARSAQQMAGSAQQASAIASQGGQSVEQMLETMNRIQQQAQASAQKVQQLDELGQQIGSIVQTIEQIAEQTNLLALNAAIEAARAGEHGRGFAVVADEVRKLAEQAGSATKEIASLIGNVRAGVDETVRAIQETSEQIADGYARSEQVGEALAQIVQSAQQVAGEVQSVTAVAEEMSASVQQVLATVSTVLQSAEENERAVQEMASSSEQVSSAIASVASISEEAAASAQQLNASSEEVAAAAQELARMAQQLQQEVSQFRIEREGEGTRPLRLAA